MTCISRDGLTLPGTTRQLCPFKEEWHGKKGHLVVKETGCGATFSITGPKLSLLQLHWRQMVLNIVQCVHSTSWGTSAVKRSQFENATQRKSISVHHLPGQVHSHPYQCWSQLWPHTVLEVTGEAVGRTPAFWTLQNLSSFSVPSCILSYS